MHGNTRVEPQTRGAPLYVWLTEQQRRTPGKGLFKCLNRQSSGKGLSKEASDHQLPEAGKRLWEGHTFCSWGSLCPCILGTTKVPATQAAVTPSHSVLMGQSYHRLEKRPVSVHAESLQMYSTLWDPVDRGLPGFSFWGILQARILELVTIPF